MSTVASRYLDEYDPLYPDSDGKPMAESTTQYDWIVTIKGGLENLYCDDPNVFIAGDLLWYPVKGQPAICSAPDALVAFGRPKGARRSYKNWVEDGVAPHVVFEVLSPSNTPAEMEKKREFYERYGVEEYYVYDPERFTLVGYLRDGEELIEIESVEGWISPRLNVRFSLAVDGKLQMTDADGEEFLHPVEIYRDGKIQRLRAEDAELRAKEADEDRRREHRRADRERQHAEQERQRAEQERQRAELERQRAELERQRAERAEQEIAQERERVARLLEKLKGLGIDSNDL